MSADRSNPIVPILEVVRVTMRQLLGRRRTLLLALFASLPLLLAVISRMFDTVDVASFTDNVFNPLSMVIVLPLAAVLFGTGAFGAEIDEGTAIYLLSKPMSRWSVVLAKTLAATILTLTLSVGSVLVAAAIDALPGDNGLAATEAYVAATVVGAVCYVSLFVALSIFTRRALVIGIGYTLIWEGALSAILAGIANLSVRQYALGIADAFFQLGRNPAPVPPTTALILSVILVVAAMVIATWKLRRFELSGGGD